MDQSDEDIYRELRGDLIGYATVLVGPADAEDVLSTVLLRVLAKRSLNSLDDARPYLFRAILNEARGLRRKRRHAVASVSAEAPQIAEYDQSVVDAVRKLPPRQRAAVYHVYWEDLTVENAARVLGARPGTVKRYLFLARKAIRGELT